MSYTIPESIVGSSLFVPTANDFFSVQTAGLPNGQDCLKVLGGTNRDYKAYQDVLNVSPDLFCYSGSNTTRSTIWSMSFWFKGDNITSAGAGLRAADEILFGVHNSSWNGVTSQASGFNSQAYHWGWSVSHYAVTTGAQCGLGFTRGGEVFNPAQQMNGVNVATTITPNVWHLVVIATSALGSSGATPQIAIDLQNAYTAGGGGGASSVGVGPGQKMCIGAYSDISGVNGRQGDWYIGKLAFHNHVLNATERAILYRAMWG